MFARKGFTLIEVMIAIVIIAILSVIAFTVFGGLTFLGNDFRRKGDVSAVAKAFETHFDRSSVTYPASLDERWFSGGNIPTPPEGGSYEIFMSEDNSGFRVCAKLEGNTNSCSETSNICFCVESGQGKFIAQGSPATPPPSTPPATPPPTLCDITQAYWTPPATAVQGENVILTVVGSSECIGKTVNFSIKEDDLSGLEDSGDDDVFQTPLPQIFTISTVTANWSAEWQDDCVLGACNPPEYYFDAIVTGEDSLRSALLTVNQTPNQPPTCTSINGPNSLNTGQLGGYTVTANDTDGTITGYAWTASVGSPTTGSSSTFDWTPGTSGNQTINLTVTDDDGAESLPCPTKNVTVTTPFVDADGDGVDDPSDCAPTDNTRWQNLTCFTDEDNDTFTVGSAVAVCKGTSCTSPIGHRASASAQADCYDKNTQARSTQTGYFTATRGTSILGNDSVGNPWNSFDYNCNGSEDPRWPLTSYPAPLCTATIPSGVPGFINGPVPACGVNVANGFRRCLGYTGGTSCQVTPAPCSNNNACPGNCSAVSVQSWRIENLSTTQTCR